MINENFGNIVIIDSDADDNEMFVEIMDDLKVDPKCVRIFVDHEDALRFFQTTEEKIGVIFCEIFLTKTSGMEFKKQLQADGEVRKKSIPFILMSTSIQPSDIETAYLELPVQGLFLKQDSYQLMKDMVETVLAYWSKCVHPSDR